MSTHAQPPSSTHPPELPHRGINPWLVRLPILVITGGIMLGLLLVMAVGAVQLLYSNRIIPNVWANGVNLGGMTPERAVAALEETFNYDDDTVFTFRAGDRFWQAAAGELGVQFDAASTVAQAFSVGHGRGFVDNVIDQSLTWLNGENISPEVRYDQGAAVAFLSSLARDIDHAPSEARLVINGADIQAAPGEPGETMDVTATLAALDSAVTSLQPGGEIQLVVHQSVPLTLDSTLAADKARIALSGPVTLAADDGRGGSLGPWVLPVEQIEALLRVETLTAPDGSQSYDVTVDTSVYRPYLESLAQGLIVPSLDGRFHFDTASAQLVSVVAPINGRVLNVDRTLERLTAAIFSPNERVVPLVFDYQEPRYSNSVTAAELGITELVSEGVSYYTGSTESRRQNIATAISRFDGLIIGPGEEFSFNRYVGDISPEEGYVEGFVIMGDQTVKGVGGGVCQVSTTVFRAAFYAGFPMTERWAHGYRVGYYESGDPDGVGMDAAIYTPDLDLRFINDTPYHLLIESFLNPTNNSVHFRFYSTNPGRQVVRGPAEIVNETPPAETQYVMNPNLTAGQQMQVDWAVGGAYVRVPRIIQDLAGNEIRREYIASQYQPWGAVIQVPAGDPRLG
ncbi:MAG: VanW family protein [Anaerolineae bacterium]|nr:VanW family protein [Anaerolineae bacterium]